MIAASSSTGLMATAIMPAGQQHITQHQHVVFCFTQDNLCWPHDTQQVAGTQNLQVELKCSLMCAMITVTAAAIHKLYVVRVPSP